MAITSLNIADGTIKKTRMSKFKIVSIVVILVLVVTCIAVGVCYYKGVFGKKTSKPVEPPNPTQPLPPSPSHLRVFKRAAVCADGAPCAEIGMSIFKKNGSAVDATIATMLCNGVYTMQSMGLGGGFFMTIYNKEENKAYILNAREKAPAAARPEMYKDDKSKSLDGPFAIGVPGEVKGYYEAHKRFGKLPWRELVQPTVEMCENGYNMSDHQHTSILRNRTNPKDTNFNEWFKLPNGEFKKVGSMIIPKKLCETLKRLRDDGPDSFYTGALAADLAKDLADIESLITLDDLQNYTAEWQEPVTVNFGNGDTLYSAGAPGSGLLLGFIMNILDGYNFTSESIRELDDRVLTYHRIIEAFKYAYARRTELGDPDFVDLTGLKGNLTSLKYAEEIRGQISDNSTSKNPKDYGAIFYTDKENHGTAHVSVLAENGDAVSVTSSVNIYFGSGMTGNRTGVILNDVINDFSFPYFENYFGLPGSPSNELAPGKRPLSSMTPSIIVDKNGDVRLVIGASGGTKITTAIALVMLRILRFGQNVKEAVDAPRFHHQLYPMTVSYEYGLLQQEIDALKKFGHEMTKYDGSSGSIICALFKSAEKIFANADYRKGGDVYGLD